MKILGIVTLGFLLTLLAIAVAGNDAGAAIEVSLLQ